MRPADSLMFPLYRQPEMPPVMAPNQPRRPDAFTRASDRQRWVD